jgi:DNA polymerase-3 subunit delta
MTQAELQRALAEHRIPPLLCLYGAEGYLVERTWRRILDLVVPADARDFNFQQFAGRETRAVTLLDAVQTLPVFSPRRLVLVKAVEDLPAAEQEALLPYLKNPLPETVLLLVGEKIDTRRKLFLELRKAGVLVEF